jgi:D-glycero-alpha-D-manno-heptose-7-phosphate kinase
MGAMMTAAPLRVTFAGGGTDVPLWYMAYGGTTISCTLRLSMRCTCTRRIGYKDCVADGPFGSVSYELGGEQYTGTGSVVKAAARAADFVHRLELRCDAPYRAGLGGSSAAAAAVALQFSKFSSPHELAEHCVHTERELCKHPGGEQDQYTTAYGGLLRVEYSADGVTVEQLPYEQAERMERHLLLLYTGNRCGPMRPWKFGQELACQQQLADRAAAALRCGSFELLGDTLRQAYELKEKSHICSERAKALYRRALAAGALGGKLLGAGGGGYLLLVCRDREAVRAAVGGELVEFSSERARVCK